MIPFSLRSIDLFPVKTFAKVTITLCFCSTLLFSNFEEAIEIDTPQQSSPVGIQQPYQKALSQETFKNTIRESKTNNIFSSSLQKIFPEDEVKPESPPLPDLSPGFIKQDALLRKQIATGKAQFLAGDYEGAWATFSNITFHAPSNPEAKIYL